MFKNSKKDREKIKFCGSVKTISPYSFEARELKFGMKIYLINTVKLVGHFFEFLSRSWNNWVNVHIANKVAWLRLDSSDI